MNTPVPAVLRRVASLGDPVQDGLNRDPVDVLRDDPDPMSRSRAHTQLGCRAAARQDVDRAVFHFRRAVDLDPTDETPKDALRSLGHAAPAEATAVDRPKGWLGRLLERAAKPRAR